MELLIDDHAVRQAISAALTSSMAVPAASWSRDFVKEAVLAELTSAANSNSTSSAHSDDTAVVTTSTNHANSNPSPSAVADSNVEPAAYQVVLAAPVLKLIDQYQQAVAAAAATAHSSNSSSDSARFTAKPNSSRTSSSNKRSKAVAKVQDQVQGVVSSSNSNSTSSWQSPEMAGVREQLQAMFGQLLLDNYQQVEDADVAAFGFKLLHELSRLVKSAMAAQQDDVGGLCQLCEREMPLTKHHLIPRDVHKDFKKKGFGFTELQSGVMVCRPCHSAIHRAVPDNKELGLHYRTLDTLRQHKDIANFSGWARRQRVTSKADVNSSHFKYRR